MMMMINVNVFTKMFSAAWGAEHHGPPINGRNLFLWPNATRGPLSRSGDKGAQSSYLLAYLMAYLMGHTYLGNSHWQWAC